MTASASLSPDGELADVLAEVLARARTLEQAGDSTGALAALDGAPESTRAIGTFHYARGALLVRRGELDAGVAALRTAVELEPEIAEMKSNLGAALLERVQRGGPQKPFTTDQQADLHEAVSLLSEAAGAAPRLPEVHANHGHALTLAGRTPEALMAFDRALALDGTHIPALYNKAAALSAAERYQACLAVLDDLLRIAPDFAEAKASRERTLQRLQA